MRHDEGGGLRTAQASYVYVLIVCRWIRMAGFDLNFDLDAVGN